MRNIKVEILVFCVVSFLVSTPFLVSVGQSSSQVWYGYGDSVFLFKDGNGGVLGALYYKANYTLFIEELSSGNTSERHLTGNVSQRVSFQSFGNATHEPPIAYVRSVNSTVTREIGTEHGSNTRFTLSYLEGFNLTTGETWSQNGPMDISAGPYPDPIAQPYFYIQRKDTLEAVMADGRRWVTDVQTLFFEGELTAEQGEICHLFQSYQVIDKTVPPKREVIKDYEELQRDYESLQEDYLNLNKSHPELLEDYNELASNYTKFMDNYESLNSTYRDLQSDYNSLQSDYNSLQNTKDDLQSEYNSMQEEYQDLQSDYDSLQSNYTSSQDDYDSLRAKYESTTQSLGTTKTIIYVLIGSTIILSLVLIYLAIKIKREMDATNQEKRGEPSSEGKKVGASREYGELPEEREST